MTRPFRVVEESSPYVPDVGALLVLGVATQVQLGLHFARGCARSLGAWALRMVERGRPACEVCGGSEKVGDAECWKCREWAAVKDNGRAG